MVGHKEVNRDSGYCACLAKLLARNQQQETVFRLLPYLEICIFLLLLYFYYYFLLIYAFNLMEDSVDVFGSGFLPDDISDAIEYEEEVIL